MKMELADIGMIGLGVMGRNLVLNIADHGFSAAGFDLDTGKIEALRQEAGDRAVQGADSLAGLIRLLKEPRAVILLIPAGPGVDGAIAELLPHLKPGDLMIDGGNSHFKDTDRRAKTVSEKGVLYLGMGISGGERGARLGPSLMPGGERKAYDRVKPILESVAAKVEGEPCVAWMGTGSAGHYVKMVHNGIEYGIMQLIAETYDLMKRGLALSNDDLHRIYDGWNRSRLESYLLEITAHIFLRQDERTGGRLIDAILDEAEQKGTGKWASQDAMDLGIPVPTLDIAVSTREISAAKESRASTAVRLHGTAHAFTGDGADFPAVLREAFHCAAALAYIQGLELLRNASDQYRYGLNLKEVVRIWRGGCIIRSAMLDRLYANYGENQDISDFLTGSSLGEEARTLAAALREVVCRAAGAGIPVPAHMVSLAYFEARRSARLPANLIQAQRDYFGAHGYRRVDEEGTFHTDWEN